MSYMSDLDLKLKEEQDGDGDDPWSYYEQGEHAFIAGGKNPYKQGSYAWAEWERGWLEISKRESRGE